MTATRYIDDLSTTVEILHQRWPLLRTRFRLMTSL